MWKTKIMAPVLAVAISMMVMAISASPVVAEGPNYSLELNGMAKLNGANGNGHTWNTGATLPATLFMASTELPAYADLAIGDEDEMIYESVLVTSIVYVLDPAGVNGVDVGDITINFEEGSLVGDIQYAAEAAIYPGYIYYFELSGMDGQIGDGIGQEITLTDMAGVCWISNIGVIIEPDF